MSPIPLCPAPPPSKPDHLTWHTWWVSQDGDQGDQGRKSCQQEQHEGREAGPSAGAAEGTAACGVEQETSDGAASPGAQGSTPLAPSISGPSPPRSLGAGRASLEEGTPKPTIVLSVLPVGRPHQRSGPGPVAGEWQSG